MQSSVATKFLSKQCQMKVERAAGRIDVYALPLPVL